MGPTAKMDLEPESLQQQLITARQQIAELIQTVQDSLLAKESAERSCDLTNQLLAEAKEDVKALVYGIGHDLRQPLRSILTNAQLLDRRNPDLPQVKEYAGYIVEGAQEINILVDNLMRFSKAGSNLRRSTVNLKLPVDLALFRLQALISESGATVAIQELPSVEIDEAQFTTVFEHLITNAIRYRSEDIPQIAISSTEGEAHSLVSVADNGCGIEERYRTQVFEPLKRLHGKNIPGVGLGLSISQKIIRAHGGTIWVDSDGTNGSTFRFTVPL